MTNITLINTLFVKDTAEGLSFTREYDCDCENICAHILIDNNFYVVLFKNNGEIDVAYSVDSCDDDFNIIDQIEFNNDITENFDKDFIVLVLKNAPNMVINSSYVSSEIYDEYLLKTINALIENGYDKCLPLNKLIESDTLCSITELAQSKECSFKVTSFDLNSNIKFSNLLDNNYLSSNFMVELANVLKNNFKDCMTCELKNFIEDLI